jgi:1-acyl-sn-glycerol-3-phosphate acyltransferase
MAKHQSTWETIFFHQFLPPMAIVLKRELLWVPFFGWALALLHPISINRSTTGSAVKQLMRQGKQHLSKGRWVLIFPEGTRTAPGVRKAYGIGGAMLAAHSGYPIVPAAHNAGEFWPRRKFIKRPGTIRLVFGPPIETQGYSARELNILTADWIENTMKRISTVEETKPPG